MRHAKRFLFLLPVLALVTWPSPSQAYPACDYVEWQMSNGVCVWSWCYGTGCQAMDCVYNNGTESHEITSQCGVS